MTIQKEEAVKPHWFKEMLINLVLITLLISISIGITLFLCDTTYTGIYFLAFYRGPLVPFVLDEVDS